MAEFSYEKKYIYDFESSKYKNVLYRGDDISLLTNNVNYVSASGIIASASFALTALTASYAVSASYEINYETSSSYADFAVSSSYSVSSSLSENSTTSSKSLVLSGSFAGLTYLYGGLEGSNSPGTARALNSTNLTYNTTTRLLNASSSYALTAATASYVLNAISSSYALTSSYVNPLNQNIILTGSLDITGSTTLNGKLNIDNKYYFINSLSDLPTPVSTVITLADNATYVFTTTVDLLGNRLVCGQNTTILGGSSENCRIKSTGLTGIPLISSSYSLPMRGITIEADVALELNASGSTQAIDWFGVNFTNYPTVGLIKNYSNVIMTDCAFLEAANCTFDGTIGTVGFVTCLFNGRSGQTIMSVSPTGSITRRFRPIYSSFIALSGETALSIPTSSIVNAEGFILDTCNFAGGETYIDGANTGSLKSLFVNNVGITNTTNVGHYYMINNTTNTTIGVPNVNVWVKAAGTTTEGIGNSPKWEPNGNNRLDYSGSIAQDFKFTAVGTVQSATVNQVISVGVAKNGTIQDESEVTVRTATANQPYPFAVQDLVQVAAGDYVEVFVKNTNSTDIRVGDLNVIIDKIGS